MDRYINAPIDNEIVNSLKAGDCVYITGTIYTARDAAHKRMYEAIKNGENIPFELKNNIIYYLGPSGERRTGHRLSRTNYKQPNGQIYTIAA